MKLDNILHTCSNQKLTVIVFGDFKVDHLIDNHRRRQLDSILNSFNLSSTITFSPRIGSNSFTTIDSIFLDKHYYENFEILFKSNSLSDHDAQFLMLHLPLNERIYKQSHGMRNINKYTISEFQLALSY